MNLELVGHKFGRYLIEKEIGRGGFATVYKAQDIQLNRWVALKILHVQWSNDSSFVERFKQEAHFLANLQHPNIVTVYDAGEINGFLYITMNLMEGVTLQEAIEKKGTFSLTDTVKILQQLADTLDYAHSKGVVHRDLKPANVMLTSLNGHEQVTLMDFGLVKAIENSLALTRANSILGTVEYMAPERFNLNSPSSTNPASDRYSLGVIAYYMLRGALPFSGEPLQVMYAHQNHSIPVSSLKLFGLKRSTIDAILKMLAKEPEDRFNTCREFISYLDETLTESVAKKSIPFNQLISILTAFVGIQLLLVFLVRQVTQSQSPIDTYTTPGNASVDPANEMYHSLMKTLIENENECLPSGRIDYVDWSVSYTVTPSDGLMAYEATFRGAPVFKSIKLVEWHEDYGTSGYRMSIGCSGIGGFPIAPYDETVVREILTNEQRSEQPGFEIVQDFRMSNWGSMCNARYTQVYQFFGDGSFRVINGAYGKGCGTNAVYRPIVRLDIAVQGDENDNFAFWNGDEWEHVKSETYRSPYSDFSNGPHSVSEDGFSWYVFDIAGDGYYIEPNQGLSGSEQKDDPFVYITLQHDGIEGDTDLDAVGDCCEDDFRQGPEMFLNNETIANQNIVLWYIPQMETIVSPEDYRCWTLQTGANPVTYPCWSGLKFVLMERFIGLDS